MILRKLHMVTLEQRRAQNMLVTVYKCLHGAASSNIRSYLQVRDGGSYILKGYAKLKPPAVIDINIWSSLFPSSGPQCMEQTPGHYSEGSYPFYV